MDKRPLYVKVTSLLEFARLVCVLERIPRISFLHKLKDSKVISVQMDLLKKRPVIYYFPLNTDGEFISFGFKDGKEVSEITNIANNSQRIFSPIIHIKSMPPNLLEETEEIKEKYHPLQVRDLTSIAKLSYGYEEAPFPLFMFPYENKWMLGIFMNLNEEGESYFCFTTLDENPHKAFLKYSTSSGLAPELVNSIGSHGFSYIKIIELEQTHPLIYYEQLQK